MGSPEIMSAPIDPQYSHEIGGMLWQPHACRRQQPRSVTKSLQIRYPKWPGSDTRFMRNAEYMQLSVCAMGGM